MEKLEELLSDSSSSNVSGELVSHSEVKHLQATDKSNRFGSQSSGCCESDKPKQQSSNGQSDLKSAQVKGLSLLEIEPNNKIRVPFSNQSPKCSHLLGKSNTEADNEMNEGVD
jgi:hypothetical protein